MLLHVSTSRTKRKQSLMPELQLKLRVWARVGELQVLGTLLRLEAIYIGVILHSSDTLLAEDAFMTGWMTMSQPSVAYDGVNGLWLAAPGTALS